MTVSIVIPVYNVSDYIERCIRSVMAQRYKNIECIIVDDATPDDSVTKCIELIAKYAGPIRFSIIHHKNNRGLSAARNTGTDAATGEYVYYLDSDDVITPDCLMKLSEVAKVHPDAEMISGNYYIIRNNVKEKIGLREELPAEVQSNEALFALFQKDMIPPFSWNKMMKLSFIRTNHLRFKEGIIYEDILWRYHIVKYLNVAYFVKDVTYWYYKRAGSLSTAHNEFTYGFSFSVIYDDIIHNLKHGKEREELKHSVEGFCYNYIMYKKAIPTYKSLIKDYKKSALHYGCRIAYLKLCLTFVLGILPFVGKHTFLSLKGVRQLAKTRFR